MPSFRSTSLASLLAAVVVTVAGCYGGAPAPGATAEPPASGSPVAPLATPGCPNFVEVVETGPLPGDDGTEDGPLAREQQRISGDVDLAVQYGADHSDEFASVRYENGPRVRLVIGFTAHVEEHCAALRAILEYPDEFEIIRQPATEAQLDDAMREIVEMAGESFQSVGRGGGELHLNLRADGEDVAAEVHAAYGELAEIVVGMLPYPDRFGGPPRCAPETGERASDAPLHVALVLDTDPVASGADFHGEVIITNTDSAPFDFQSGPTQTAVVYLPGAATPSGFFTGGMDAIGFGARLAPAEAVTLDVIGGTASCDPVLGYALPPGSYEVRVRVHVQTMHDNAPTEVSYLLSEPVPLTIVP
jgi:hypothetical protein